MPTIPTAYPRPGAYINEELVPLTTGANQVQGKAVAAFANVHNIGPVIPVLCSSWQTFATLYGDFSVANQNPLHYAVYSYFVNGGQACFVLRVPNTDAVAASIALKDLGAATVFTATAAQSQVISPGAWGNNLYIEIVALNGSTTRFNLNIYNVPAGKTAGPGYMVESFMNISTNPADPRYVLTIVNSPLSGSNYIQLSGATNTYTAGTTDFQPITPTAMTGGSDGVTAPTLSFASTVQQAFDNYCSDQILNLNIPGPFNAATGSYNTNTNINTLASWASQREDVFLLVDGPAPNNPETSAEVVTAYTAMINGGESIAETSYVGVYAPYILIQDPASSSIGATRLIAPSGSLLGLWAFTDNLIGPQQVAAGIQYGQISCLDLEVRFTPTDLDNLYPININAIKRVPSYGFCAYGARTLMQGYQDMFIPVRRVLMKIEHDARQLTQFAMFEPNTPKLWANVTTVLTNYLTSITLSGMLAYDTPGNAFTVTCDSTNNTQASAATGIMYINIAVALGSPVEIIVINLSQLTSGALTSNAPNGTLQ